MCPTRGTAYQYDVSLIKAKRQHHGNIIALPICLCIVNTSYLYSRFKRKAILRIYSMLYVENIKRLQMKSLRMLKDYEGI